MQISKPKRISSASAGSKESREAINTVSASVSSFNQELYLAVMGNLTIGDNLNMGFVTVDVNVDANGVPNRAIKFKSQGLIGRAVMVLCGRVSKAVPVGGVMVSFTETSGVLEITHLTGLTADTDYQLTLLLIGS